MYVKIWLKFKLKFYDSPNLITQMILTKYKSISCYDWQLKMVQKEALTFLMMVLLIKKRSPPLLKVKGKSTS